MTWPPVALRVRVIENGRRKVRLWLPLFVLWPLLLLLAGSGPLVAFVGSLLGWRTGRTRAALPAARQLFVIFCHLGGLEVDVQTSEAQVYVAFR